MFEHFAYRHIPPLLLASTWTVGGLMSFTYGPEEAILTLGLGKHVASSKAAWPLIQLEGSRITTIGLALWGIYLGGHLEAMDILLSCIGWMGIIDGVVLYKDGSPGSARSRATYQSVVALWGLFGMTSGKYFYIEACGSINILGVASRSGVAQRSGTLHQHQHINVNSGEVACIGNYV